MVGLRWQFLDWSCSPPFSCHDAGLLAAGAVLLLGWSACLSLTWQERRDVEQDLACNFTISPREAAAALAPPAILGVAGDTNGHANEMPVQQDVDVNDASAGVFWSAKAIRTSRPLRGSRGFRCSPMSKRPPTANAQRTSSSLNTLQEQKSWALYRGTRSSKAREELRWSHISNKSATWPETLIQLVPRSVMRVEKPGALRSL
jgi:hypothetical protein